MKQLAEDLAKPDTGFSGGQTFLKTTNLIFGIPSAGDVVARTRRETS